jgi:hypothetical protein
MRSIGLLFFLYSCSQLSPVTRPPRPADETLVSLESAYNHMRSSYLKGCVDALKEIGLPHSFDHCLDKAKWHEKEVRQIVD